MAWRVVACAVGVLGTGFPLSGCGDGGPGVEDIADADADLPAESFDEASAESDAAAARDVAGDGDATYEGIGCGATLCEVGSQVCCLAAETTPPTMECTSPTGCAGRTPVACDGPEDCAPGGTCCGGGRAVECSAAACDEGDTLCHRNTDCASGEVCCSMPDLPFAVCAPFC